MTKMGNLEKYNVTTYSKKFFVGRTFRIKEVFYDQFYKNGKSERRNHYFNYTYINFIRQDKENPDVFKGELFVSTRNGRFMLNKINPVEVEICSDVFDETVDLSITKDGDGLYLDFDHHSVLNSLFEKKGVDIYSYSMDINGEVTKRDE